MTRIPRPVYKLLSKIFSDYRRTGAWPSEILDNNWPYKHWFQIFWDRMRSDAKQEITHDHPADPQEPGADPDGRA